MCAQRGRQKQELKSRVKARSGKVCPLWKAASLLVKGFHQGNNVISEGCANHGWDSDEKRTNPNEPGVKQARRRVCRPPGESRRSSHGTAPWGLARGGQGAPPRSPVSPAFCTGCTAHENCRCWQHIQVRKVPHHTGVMFLWPRGTAML